MAGTKGIICAVVPFSVMDTEQCKEKLGRFSEDSEKSADGFPNPNDGFQFNLVRGPIPHFLLHNSTKEKEYKGYKSRTMTAFAALPSDNQPTVALFGLQKMSKVELHSRWRN